MDPGRPPTVVATTAGDALRALRDFYFIQFYFWFRVDLFTKTRENLVLKAVGAVSVIEVWVLLGTSRWVEILLGLDPVPAQALRVAVVAAVAALYLGNYALVRRAGWERFEDRIARCSERMRRGWILVAGGTALAAFGVVMSAAVVGKANG